MFGGFPFEEFAGMHGGMPGGRGGPKKEVDNKKYYELLGVDKDATMDQIGGLTERRRSRSIQIKVVIQRNSKR